MLYLVCIKFAWNVSSGTHDVRVFLHKRAVLVTTCPFSATVWKSPENKIKKGTQLY